MPAFFSFPAAALVFLLLVCPGCNASGDEQSAAVGTEDCTAPDSLHGVGDCTAPELNLSDFAAPTAVFDAASVSVGDTLSGWRVSDLRQTSSRSGAAGVRIITFQGEVTIAGRLSDRQDRLCVEPEATSAERLPRTQGDSPPAYVCIENADEARAAFANAYGEPLSVVIGRYRIRTDSTETGYARFERLVP